jgi:hypothetical protein
MNTNDSGTEAIRQALYARNKRFNLANLARDMGIASDALETFIFGKALLSTDALVKLTTYVWGGAFEYDAATDRLRPTNRQEPKTLGRGAPPIDPAKLPTFPRWDEAQPLRAPVPADPVTQPEKQKRPGWIDWV